MVTPADTSELHLSKQLCKCMVCKDILRPGGHATLLFDSFALPGRPGEGAVFNLQPTDMRGVICPRCREVALSKLRGDTSEGR